jgi:hypothetical protein
MCFDQILKTTAITAFLTPTLKVFITETGYVYCTVRTKPLTIIRVNFCLRRVNIILPPMHGSHYSITCAGRTNCEVLHYMVQFCTAPVLTYHAEQQAKLQLFAFQSLGF